MKQNAMRTTTAVALLAAAGLACPALGQDSFGVSSGTHNNVGGDALRAHNTAEQGNPYVVDLTSLTTSWNTQWGIGILAKTSKVGASPNAFFNTLFSNHALSADFLTGVDRSGMQYRLWESADWSLGIAPGVNATANSSQYVDIAGPASAMQLGWGFSDFGGNENSNVIGGTVAWDASNNPGRLYVNRVVGAVNNSADDVAGSSDQSFSSVDAAGNIYIRADRELVTGNSFPISGLNLLRYDSEARNLTKINWLNSQLIAGTSTATNDVAATSTIASNYSFNFIPPSNIGSAIGKRCITTTAFDAAGDFYFFENPANTPNFVLDGHVDAPLADGLRGAMRVVPLNWLGGVATGVQLIKPQNGSSYSGGTISNPAGETWGFSVWGIDNTGAVVGGSKRTYALPHAFTVPGAPIVDNAAGVSGINPATAANYVVPNLAEFDNYRGTAAFRGPVSQVALGQDLSGNRYVAAVVYNPPQIGTRFAPGNAVVVGKINTGSAPGTVTWSVAAWNNYDGSVNGVSGKAILDGPGGNVIGRLVPYEIAETLNLRGGFSNGSVGPSISCPAMDAAGNIYFVSTIQLQRGNNFDDFFNPQLPLIDNGSGQITQPNPERDIYELGLIRAVLDPATFTYQLELVTRTGLVYSGGNTGTDYLVESFSLVNNNNSGPSPAQFDSGSTSVASRNNATPANNQSADTLGGLVISAKVIYDNDGLDTVTPANSADGLGFAMDYPVSLGGNGAFEDMSLGLTPFFPLSSDQAYNAVMFIGNSASDIPTGACCVDVTICSEGTEFDCLSVGGVYQGDGVTCASNPCGPIDPTGACCFSCTGGTAQPPCPAANGPVVGCAELTAAACSTAGGLYVGDNSTCTQGIGGPCDCAGDINNDGNCNAADFVILSGNFGGGVPNCLGHSQGDLNCDGVVNAADFVILSGSFGCTRN